MNPDYAIISCGEDNSYGHPHKDTMDKLEKADITIFQTDKQGTIVVQTDGEQLSFFQEE